MEDFAKDIEMFIKKCFNIQYILPDTRTVGVDDSGNLYGSICSEISIFDSEKSSDLKIAAILHFDLLDMMLERSVIGLDGKSFHAKYQCLPKSSSVDVMISEVYRLLKIFRNAMVHNRESISFHSEINVSYIFNETVFKLVVNERIFLYILTIVKLYSILQSSNDEYTKGIMRWIYQQILDGVHVEDEFGNSLMTLTNNDSVSPFSREIFDVATVNASNGCVSIPKSPYPQQVEQNHIIDYVFTVDSVKYIVAEEMLGVNRSILVEDLSKYKMPKWRM